MRWTLVLALTFPSLLLGGTDPGKELVHKDGIFRVYKDVFHSPKTEGLPCHYLMKIDVHFGLNFLKPEDPKDHGNPQKDFSRLPTCYHHLRSPVGIVMQTLEPFPSMKNVSWGDIRLPASLVGLTAPLSPGLVPDSALVGMESPPPYAVVGMHVGTMAAYAQPFQEVDFYENNPKVIELSLPKKGVPYFTYIQDAKARGANVKLFQGKERETLAKKAPNDFYQVIVVEMCLRSRLDDVCVEFMTEEGMALLMDKLRDNGILCYHVSNRYFNMTPVLADAAKELGLVIRHSMDRAPDGVVDDRSHFQSEWVMIARKQETLAQLKPPADYADYVEKAIAKEPYWKFMVKEPYWDTPVATGKHVWTDKSPHLVKGLMRSDPNMQRLQSVIYSMAIAEVELAYGNKLDANTAKVYQKVNSYISGTFRPLNEAWVHLRTEAGLTMEDLQKGWPEGY
jgi:hypothetical protein